MGKQALDGKRLNAFEMDPDKITVIGLDTTDGPEHPLYDKRIHIPVSEALVKNIMVNGVLENVVVRKNGDDVIECVVGRQRIRAAREANRRLREQGCETIGVPTMVRRGAGDAAAMGFMISENELRQEDEIDSKLDKLERYMALGKSVEDAAVQFGVEAATIKSWLLLIEAGPEVKKAVKKGLLSATAGAKLAKLPRDQQAEAVKEATADGKATVQKASRVARAKRGGKAGGDGAAVVAIVPPSKRLLRKLVEAPDFQQLDAYALQVLRWVLGDVPAACVYGLTEVMQKIEGGHVATEESEAQDAQEDSDASAAEVPGGDPDSPTPLAFDASLEVNP